MNLRELLFLHAASGGGGSLVENTATGNPVAFNTNVAKPLNSVVVPLTYTQEGTGDPSPSNVRPISGVSSLFCVHARKNMGYLRGYSAETKLYDQAGTLSNRYGTALSTTSPESSLVVTQSQSTTDYTKNNYRNGYFIVRTDNMVVGQHYDVSIKVTDIISNPLEVGLSDFSITSPNGGVEPAKEVIGNVVIWHNLLYKDTNGRQFWEFRNCGMSCTVSEFMITPANTNDGVYEAYDGAKLDVVFPAFGKNLLDKNNVINGYFGSSGGNTVITSNSNARIVWMPCKPNTTYTCHKMQGGNRFDVYAAQNEPKAGDVVITTSTITGNTYLKKVTTPENAKYLCMFVWLASADPNITAQDMIDSVMVEEGDVTPSAYEPYNNSVYGGSLDLVSGVLILTHKMQTITGEEQVTYTVLANSIYCGSDVFFSDSKSGTIIYGESSIVPQGSNGSVNTGYLKKSHNNQGIQFYHPVDFWGLSEMSQSALEAKLQEWNAGGTPLQVVYELATPITVQLTPAQASAFVGDNTVWTNTTGDLTIKYLNKA